MRIRRLGSSAILTHANFGGSLKSLWIWDMGFWVCQFSLGMEMSVRNRGLVYVHPSDAWNFGKPEILKNVSATESLGRGFLYRRQVLGAYCFAVKSLDAQNFGRDSFFNKTRNFIIGLDNVDFDDRLFLRYRRVEFSLIISFFRKPVALQVSLDLFGRIGFHIDV
ncbi:hypothetical protein RIR_jg33294.t1 [Rhizophagus irregularis DAOM 181602=DAOM 197198]|nr:hypothetical protein RIR_jg33294.t1 [Rhizophagus irregularis DAOM 181602=DAOM 197198]